jgi:hypothetical protein
LAFKRFSRFKKIKTLIDYPIEGFDIGPYLRSKYKLKKAINKINKSFMIFTV